MTPGYGSKRPLTSDQDDVMDTPSKRAAANPASPDASMASDSSPPRSSPRAAEVGDDQPIFAGVVGADGKTSPKPDDFRELIGKTMEVHASWA